MFRKSVSIAGAVLIITAIIFFYFSSRSINFNLQDNHGNVFTEQNLEGQWSLVFFGFTHCPMMCPLTMSTLQEMYQTLERELPTDKLPQVVLITLDPERDTIQRLNEYVTAFNPKFIGVRGDKNETAELIKQFHVIAIKMQAGNGNDQYTLNHGGEILMFNPQGKLTAAWAYPHAAKDLLAKYKAVVQRD